MERKRQGIIGKLGKGQYHSNLTDEEKESRAKLAAGLMQSGYWRWLEEEITHRMDGAFGVLRRTPVVGEGASKVARAQGEVDVLEWLLGLPEATARLQKKGDGNIP